MNLFVSLPAGLSVYLFIFLSVSSLTQKLKKRFCLNFQGWLVLPQGLMDLILGVIHIISRNLSKNFISLQDGAFKHC